MKIFPKQSKTVNQSKRYYYGNYGEIPIGISSAVINENDIYKDDLHYHKKGVEFYIATQGAAIIEIESEEVELNENQIVMVESGEKHKIKSIQKTPFSFIVICTVKDREDKVFSE